MKLASIFCSAMLCAAIAAGQSISCDVTGYKPAEGLRATQHAGILELTWQGERSEQLRASFTIRNSQPQVQELGIFAYILGYVRDKSHNIMLCLLFDFINLLDIKVSFLFYAIYCL